MNSEEIEYSVCHMNHIYDTFMVLFWSINPLKMLTEAQTFSLRSHFAINGRKKSILGWNNPESK